MYRFIITLLLVIYTTTGAPIINGNDDDIKGVDFDEPNTYNSVALV